ncbi:MAG: AmpG family muropeptide MFS transporter [Desulfobulbaceae bacterium]|nr:AmpG family muropeptide MFS transporter [Desulfobulbaceae bacterium]
MSREGSEIRSWSECFRTWVQPKAIAMLFLGFSAGIPILLIFSTLSVWLREAGVDRSAVTFFSWAALGYSFKFLWAPIIDMLPLPVLTRMLGRRRAWLIIAQCCIIIAIYWMSSVDPAAGPENLTFMAMASVLLGFSSASQDVVIDAYRIESAEQSLQALLSSMYIAGYRIGMLVAGAGSLFLADYMGGGNNGYSYHAWRITYLTMAVMMGCGFVTTLCIAEPQDSRTTQQHNYSAAEYLRFVMVFLFIMLAFAATFFKTGFGFTELRKFFSFFPVVDGNFGTFCVEILRFGLAVIAGFLVAWFVVKTGLLDKSMVHQAYYAPVRDFFSRYGGKTAGLLLLLIGFYRLSDIVLGVVSNVFYLDMGFSKTVIAGITKSFGLGMTLVGGFMGGLLTIRFGIQKILFLGAFLSAATNLLFMLLAGAGSNVTLLTLVIGADNLSAGIATTAFVAFLSSLTSVSFTAVQYAILSSMMTLLPKMVGGYSGTMVSGFGYEKFFLLTAVMGIPVLLLILVVQGLSLEK